MGNKIHGYQKIIMDIEKCNSDREKGMTDIKKYESWILNNSVCEYPSLGFGISIIQVLIIQNSIY